MSLDTSVNWPLFIFTSLIICLRSYAPAVCLWILNKFYSPSSTTDTLTEELKCITKELATISQQDEFATYCRKERRRNTLIQQLNDQKSTIETKQNTLLIYIRLLLNGATVLMMIFLTITGRRHESIPLFNFPFFRFPLIIWIMALNTFVTTITDIYVRHQTNKTSTE
ncbi:unnamed protein product [Adineta steineri]|uniref:Guided entry of tail-anchored proteins factor 1 n=1 Tax=Adineta steineri TaxID=433720 RepID=A0A820M286_9BILA|nr:unnamed protein product [Adineta steineri]